MPKGKEEKVEVVPEVTQVDTDTEKTYSKDEYETEVNRIREEAETSKASALTEQYNKLNAKLSRKGAELQQLRQQQPQPAKDNSLGIVIDEMKAREKETGEINPYRIQLEAEKVQKDREITESERRTTWENACNSEWDKLVEAGFDPDDDRFVDVELAFNQTAYSDGKFDRVSRKLNQILKTVPKEKEVEADDFKTKVNKEIARRAEEDKLLKTDAGSPSGGKSKLTVEQIEKMSPDEQFARAAEIAAIPMGYKPLEQ